MYTAMQAFTEGHRSYQRAVRVKPFRTLEQAIQHTAKKVKEGSPFVVSGGKVVWTKRMGV